MWHDEWEQKHLFEVCAIYPKLYSMIKRTATLKPLFNQISFVSNNIPNLNSEIMKNWSFMLKNMSDKFVIFLHYMVWDHLCNDWNIMFGIPTLYVICSIAMHYFVYINFICNTENVLMEIHLVQQREEN